MYDSHQYEVMHFQSLIQRMAGHMKFIGWFGIIGGGLYSLTIIGAIIGIPYLFAGLRLKEAAEFFESYAQSDDRGLLLAALEKQERSFFIVKVILIVSLVLAAIYIVVVVALVIIGVATTATYRYN